MSESPFEHLKNSAEAARTALAESGQRSKEFPAEVIGDGFYTVSNACIVLKGILQTVDLVPQGEEICMRYMSPDEILNISSRLAETSSRLSAQDYHGFVLQLTHLVTACRPLEILFMEKTDRKRYSEAQDLDSTLLSAQKLAAAIEIISNKAHAQKKEVDASVESLKKLTETVQKLIDSSQGDLHNAGMAHETAMGYSKQINDLRDDAREKKAVVDKFFESVEQRKEELADQKKQTEEYEKALTEHQKSHEKHVKDYAEKYGEMLESAKQLIASAEKALELKSALGMSGAFSKRQKESGSRWIKCFWLIVGLFSSGIAIYMGWLSLSEAKNADIGVAFVVVRTLSVLIAIGIAGFAARQYAKNRSIEEDYAYKATLVSSYPGLVKAFGEGGESLRNEYILKLMNEVLQDPQRIRGKSQPTRLSVANKISDKLTNGVSQDSHRAGGKSELEHPSTENKMPDTKDSRGDNKNE